VEQMLGEAEPLAPDIVNVEVMQSPRGLERGGKLAGARASRAISRLTASPIIAASHRCETAQSHRYETVAVSFI
jgi:hypothetical protein